MERIEFPAPKPAVIILSDTYFAANHGIEVGNFVQAAARRASAIEDTATELARRIVNRHTPSLRADAHWQSEIEEASQVEFEPYVRGALLGIAIGREEISRGWRAPPKETSGRFRIWWEAQRPRYIDKRTLEALAATKAGNPDFFLTHHFVQLGYWQTHDPIPQGGS